MKLLERANQIDKKDPVKADIRRFQNRRVNIERKLEVLTERITELPKEVSAKPLYTKMAQLQKQKDEINKSLEKKQKELNGLMEEPAKTDNWKKFLEVFGKIFKTHLSVDDQTKLIKTLVHKIELGAKDLKIHYFVGEDHIKKEGQQMLAHLFLYPDNYSSSLTYGGFIT